MVFTATRRSRQAKPCAVSPCFRERNPVVGSDQFERRKQNKEREDRAFNFQPLKT